MTQKEMASLISDIFDDVQHMRDAGQKEYAQQEDNAFANFERISGWLDKDKKEVLMTQEPEPWPANFEKIGDHVV